MDKEEDNDDIASTIILNNSPLSTEESNKIIDFTESLGKEKIKKYRKQCYDFLQTSDDNITISRCAFFVALTNVKNEDEDVKIKFQANDS
jgi:3-methyladenine DNA glycosylase AlkD